MTQAVSHTNFEIAQVRPKVPSNALSQRVNLGPNLTLPKGTILGHSGSKVNHVFTLTASGSVTGGTLSATIEDPVTNIKKTLSFAYNISNAALQTELEKVYKTGNVAVAGGALPGTPVTITLQNDRAGMPAKAWTLDNSAITGGGSYGLATTTQGRTADSYTAASTLTVANPAAPTASAVAGAGVFTAGTYTVQVTYETANGETAGSPPDTVALVANDEVRIAEITGLDDAVTAVNVYVAGYYVGQIAVSGNTAAQTDFDGSGWTGKAIPTQNTTGNAKAILPVSVVTDEAGVVYMSDEAKSDYLRGPGSPNVEALFTGIFDTSEIVGLNPDTLAELGRLLRGTIANGLIQVGS